MKTNEEQTLAEFLESDAIGELRNSFEEMRKENIELGKKIVEKTPELETYVLSLI